MFSPTPAELTVVSRILTQHSDPQKLGILSGDIAVKVFGGAKLPATTLGEIWHIADKKNRGQLSKKGVAIAIRLIGWAQKGDKISPALVNEPGPLAVIEGITPISQQSIGFALSKSPPPFGAASPSLTQQDKTRFYKMFVKSGPVGGLLSAEQARDVFIKSKLSYEQLSRIWALADTQERGSLDSVDFAIAMYFIQGAMTGKISIIPNTLPPGLYQQAGGSVPGPSSIHTRAIDTNGSFSPVNSTFAPQLTGQLTGQSQMLQPEVTGMSSAFNTPTLSARPHTKGGLTNEWDVTPTDKASANRFFDTLDAEKKGYVDNVAVPFMSKSQLPEEILAQIWDLADFNKDGRLTRDGFAVAIHLIQKKLAGQEVPTVLPPSLIPPSRRGSAIGTWPFTPVQPQPEPVELFSFDDTLPSGGYPPAPSIQDQPVNNPFTVSFQAQPISTLDLLDDREQEASFQHVQSPEMSNVRKLLQSTQRSVAAAKQERQKLEQALAEQASQISSLQTQLSVATASFEMETTLLARLKVRRAVQVAEIQKTREELTRSESDLRAVRVQKAEIESAILRDKEDARDLHERMAKTGQQADALKADVEELKKEAMQQKALLTIVRKQLGTRESEKAKAEKGHQEATAELATFVKEVNAVKAGIASLDVVSPTAKTTSILSPATQPVNFAAAQPLPVTFDIPPASFRNNNNHPVRLGSEVLGPRCQLPFPMAILPSPPVSVNSTVPLAVKVSAPELPKSFEAQDKPASHGGPFVVPG